MSNNLRLLLLERDELYDFPVVVFLRDGLRAIFRTVEYHPLAFAFWSCQGPYGLGLGHLLLA